jgi:hypothetical protein
VFDKLTKAGMDEQLSRHFAHLFIQDPLVVYRGKVKMDDTTHSDHFENIQSTNWQSVRFKVSNLIDVDSVFVLQEKKKKTASSSSLQHWLESGVSLNGAPVS